MLPDVSESELDVMRNALRTAEAIAPDAPLKVAAEIIGEGANAPWLRCVLADMAT